MVIPHYTELRQKRKGLGISQTELANESGVSQSLIARIESGDVDPRLSTFNKILTSLEDLRENKKILVSEIMSSPVISCRPEDKIKQVSQKMERKNISQMPVLSDSNENGRIDEALISSALSGSDNRKIGNLKVKKVMKSPFPDVSNDTEAQNVIDLVKSIGAVLVKEEGEINGIITKMDLLDLIE